jgi:hypothetical protein
VNYECIFNSKRIGWKISRDTLSLSIG